MDHTRGLSWFKAEATAELAKIEELAAFVGQYGYFIERLTTDRPGYIIYEDDVQIVADPFSDTPR